MIVCFLRLFTVIELMIGYFTRPISSLFDKVGFLATPITAGVKICMCQVIRKACFFFTFARCNDVVKLVETCEILHLIMHLHHKARVDVQFCRYTLLELALTGVPVEISVP